MNYRRLQFAKMVLCFAIYGTSCFFGCAQDSNYLEGSISERFDLDFDFVKLEKESDTITLTYLDEIHYIEIGYHANNTILELSITLDFEEIVLGKWIVITDNIKLSRYVVYMEAPYELKQDERRFPNPINAEVGFFDFNSKEASGKFKIIFEDGSTMRGGFSGQWI